MAPPQKVKHGIIYDPAILLPGIYPEELKTETQTDIYTPMFTAALVPIAKRWKYPRVH